MSFVPIWMYSNINKMLLLQNKDLIIKRKKKYNKMADKMKIFILLLITAK